MACSAARTNRLYDLRAQNAIKDRELESLKKEIETLSAQSSTAANTNATDPTSPQRDGATTTAVAASPTSPSAAPLSERLLKNAKLVNNIPFEDVGNFVLEYQAQVKQEERNQKVLTSTVAELQLQLKLLVAENEKIALSTERVMNTTGVTDQQGSTYVREYCPQLRKSGNKGETAAAAAPETEREVDADGQEYDAAAAATKRPNKMLPDDDTLAAMKAAIRAKTVSLNQVEVLIKKKHDIIEQMFHAMSVLDEFELKVGEATNDYLIADRKVRQAKVQLKGIYQEHERVDAITDALKQESELNAQCYHFLNSDTTLLHEKNQALVEDRRKEDRIIKAQEFRLSILRSRVEVIEMALAKNPKLNLAVRRQLTELMDQMAALGPEDENGIQGDESGAGNGGGSGSDGGVDDSVLVNRNESSPEREAPDGAMVSVDGTFDEAHQQNGHHQTSKPTDPSEVTKKIIEKYSHERHINPESETVPRSLYVLLHQDFESRDKKARQLAMMLQEKSSTVRAVGTKLESLQEELNAAVDQQFEEQQEQQCSIDSALRNATELLEKHKSAYMDALQELTEVNAQVVDVQKQLSPKSTPTTARTGGGRATPRTARGTAATTPKATATPRTPKPTTTADANNGKSSARR